MYWNDVTSGLPLTSVGQSHSRCGFLLLASALESRDTPTCSDIQKQQLSMFIVTTFFTTPISTAPSSCSHFVPSGYNFTPKVAQTQTLFCLTCFNASSRKPGSEATFLPLHFLPPQPLSTYRQTDINAIWDKMYQQGFPPDL